MSGSVPSLLWTIVIIVIILIVIIVLLKVVFAIIAIGPIAYATTAPNLKDPNLLRPGWEGGWGFPYAITLSS